MLKLAAIDDADAKAKRIFDLEREIAAVHATRTESVEVSKANNPWTADDFSRKAPGIDWPALFRAARIGQEPTIIVWHPGAVKGIAALVQRERLETWRGQRAGVAHDVHDGERGRERAGVRLDLVHFHICSE